MADLPVPTELVGEDLETWAALATVLEWLPAALDTQLQRDSGLTHFEYGILYALGSAPERRLRMSVLAGYANSTLTRLSRAVGRLEARGWVTRSPDAGDGRYTIAELTTDGLDKLRQATPGHVGAVHDLVLSRLTKAQKRELRETSRRIMRAIRDDEPWAPAAPAPEKDL